MIRTYLDWILSLPWHKRSGDEEIALKKVEENSVPSWLWRSVPDEAALAQLPERQRAAQAGQFLGSGDVGQHHDRDADEQTDRGTAARTGHARGAGRSERPAGGARSGAGSGGRQVADRHADCPTQAEQQRRRPAGLIDDQDRVVLSASA